MKKGGAPWTNSFLSFVTLQEASVFAGLIARRMPALSEHMEALCIHPLMYVTQWYVG